MFSLRKEEVLNSQITAVTRSSAEPPPPSHLSRTAGSNCSAYVKKKKMPRQLNFVLLFLPPGV